MKRKIKKTNFFKKRLDRRARLWYNLTRQPIWGYSSAGRALEWHSRGQRFDPAYLHQQKKTVFRLSFFVGQIRDLRRNAVRTRAFSAAEAAFFGLPKKGQNAKCHPPKADIPRPKGIRQATDCLLCWSNKGFEKKRRSHTSIFSRGSGFFRLAEKGAKCEVSSAEGGYPAPQRNQKGDGLSALLERAVGKGEKRRSR